MKFKLGDEVKFYKDEDVLSGKIFSIKIDENGPVYTFTSRAFDATTNSMVEGVKIAHENELVEVGTPAVKDEVEEVKNEG